MCLCVLPVAAAHTEISSQTTLCWEEIVIIIIIIIIVMSLCALPYATQHTALVLRALYINVPFYQCGSRGAFHWKLQLLRVLFYFLSLTSGFTCYCARLLNVLFVWQQLFIIIITIIIIIIMMTIIIIKITDDTNNNNNNLLVSPHNISSASPHFCSC